MAGFHVDSIKSDVYTKLGIFDHEVERIENIHHKIIHFKNSNHYIRYFIDKLKHNVIKKYPNLSSINIHLNVFDNNNILHRLIVTVSNMIQELMKLNNRLICLKKTVFVTVSYENNIVFIGFVDFTGL
jgi:predicted transcriptional regulator